MQNLMAGSTVGTFTGIETIQVNYYLFEVEELGAKADEKSVNREVIP